MKKISFLNILLTSMVLLFIGCNNNQTVDLPKTTMPVVTKAPITPSTTEPAIDPTMDPTIEYLKDSDIITHFIDSMTLEEKVGQLFIMDFRKNKRGRNLHILDEYTKNQIEKFNLGGVIFFSENIDNVIQTSDLINDMQSASKIPLFISVDEEGGRVSRLGNNANMGITKLPSAQEVGEKNDPNFAYQLGSKLGSELSNLGFNMNFAPVADVNTNPNNRVIGNRSFSSDPEKVGIMVKEIVKGMQNQNVSAVLKHFPGHGDTFKDSHKEAVIIKHDIERLHSIEFIPFKSGISVSVDAIMTAHIIVPEVDSENLPATLSKKILTGILREDLNYDGLIITDSLKMNAIKNYWSSDQAAIMAFKAGADILLMPDSLEKAYNSILNAVIDGDITEDRIDQSIRRILEVKYKRGILSAD